MGVISAELRELTQGSVVDGASWPGLRGQGPPLSLVLSNPCDLEYDKASFLLLAALVPAHDVLRAAPEFRGAVAGAEGHRVSQTKWSKLSKALEKFIHNVEIRRFYCLDAAEVVEISPLLVDFQCLQTVPVGEAAQLTVVGGVPSPDREKLLSRFGGYISRVGVGRIDPARTEELVAAVADPYHPPSG